MTESNTIPHFYLMEEIDITELVYNIINHREIIYFNKKIGRTKIKL